MKKIFFQMVFVFLANQCFSQNHDLIFSGGIIKQKRWTGDFVIMYGAMSGGPCSPPVLAGVGLGSEFLSTAEGKTVIAPKITAQISPMLFTLKLSEINYLQGGSADIRLLPEIGLSLIGLVNVCYGYNIHLFGNKFEDISNHRMALTFCLPVPIKKSFKKIMPPQ